MDIKSSREMAEIEIERKLESRASALGECEGVGQWQQEGEAKGGGVNLREVMVRGWKYILRTIN